jgi:hypothetical protein
VEDLVHGQCSGLAKAFATIMTFERLLFRVNVAVIPQMVLPPEGLATNVTGIGPLISMSPLVDEQVVGLGELPIAELADEPLFGPR